MKEPQDSASFSVRVTSPGDYRVIMEYACAGQNKQEGIIGFDGKEYYFQALYTGEYNSHRPLLFIRHPVTICTVKTPGVYRLTVRPVQSGTDLFSLKSIILVPVAEDVGTALKLPAFFSDNMVLEQKSRAAIWGWAQPGATVRVMGSWNGKAVTGVADDNGKWKVSLPTVKAGGPYYIRVGAGSDSLVMRGVWLGEVWLASGQSNMNYPIARLASWRKGVDNYEQEIAGAKDSLIRMFTVEQAAANSPQDDVKGSWQVCSPSTAGNFSAVAYYFAREIRKRTGFPVGIIHSSVGGTPAEAWTQKEVLDTLSLSQPAGEPASGTKAPSVLYNGMIHPLAPYTIKGILWYQGESNSDRFMEYRRLLPALIASWRGEWGEELPFYFVQIAPQYSKVPGIREAQLFTYMKVPRTGMVVITDAGDSLNIHPTNKKIVGHRLALWALAKDYGEKGLVYSGPVYKNMSVEGGSVRLLFDFADGGLRGVVRGVAGGGLSAFTIAGADSVFVPARARIEGTTVVVFSERVKKPLAVRFAWKNFPRPDLYNAAGLPASPFRTDDWPL
jgi:sialate O-acetylesterase